MSGFANTTADSLEVAQDVFEQYQIKLLWVRSGWVLPLRAEELRSHLERSRNIRRGEVQSISATKDIILKGDMRTADC